MFRIVKKSTRAVALFQGSFEKGFPISDTLEIKEDWRPENYKKMLAEYQANAIKQGFKFDVVSFGIGFTACLKALGEK